MLAKQKNITQIHITLPWFSNEIITILSKHNTNIKSLCLRSTYDDCKVKLKRQKVSALNCEKLREVSKFVNLEKLHFAGEDFPADDKVMLEILQNCQNINEIKFGKSLN